MPASRSSRASALSVANTLDGDAARTVWMCLLTRVLTSSIGTRNASSLKRGRTWTCNVAHGLSLSAAMLPDKPPLWVCDTLGTRVTDEEAEGSVRVEVDGPDDREGTSGPRPAKVPSRCISLVTSLASYVRAEEGLEGDAEVTEAILPFNVSLVGMAPSDLEWECQVFLSLFDEECGSSSEELVA